MKPSPDSGLPSFLQPDMWTDYPVVKLGDIPGKHAPIRAVRVLSYDGDKYASIEVEGVQMEVKTGYLYLEPRRL